MEQSFNIEYQQSIPYSSESKTYSQGIHEEAESEGESLINSHEKNQKKIGVADSYSHAPTPKIKSSHKSLEQPTSCSNEASSVKICDTNDLEIPFFSMKRQKEIDDFERKYSNFKAFIGYDDMISVQANDNHEKIQAELQSTIQAIEHSCQLKIDSIIKDNEIVIDNARKTLDRKNILDTIETSNNKINDTDKKYLNAINESARKQIDKAKDVCENKLANLYQFVNFLRKTNAIKTPEALEQPKSLENEVQSVNIFESGTNDQRDHYFFTDRQQEIADFEEQDLNFKLSIMYNDMISSQFSCHYDRLKKNLKYKQNKIYGSLDKVQDSMEQFNNELTNQYLQSNQSSIENGKKKFTEEQDPSDIETAAKIRDVTHNNADFLNILLLSTQNIMIDVQNNYKQQLEALSKQAYSLRSPLYQDEYRNGITYEEQEDNNDSPSELSKYLDERTTLEAGISASLDNNATVYESTSYQVDDSKGEETFAKNLERTFSYGSHLFSETMPEEQAEDISDDSSISEIEIPHKNLEQLIPLEENNELYDKFKNNHLSVKKCIQTYIKNEECSQPVDKNSVDNSRFLAEQNHKIFEAIYNYKINNDKKELSFALNDFREKFNEKNIPKFEFSKKRRTEIESLNDEDLLKTFHLSTEKKIEQLLSKKNALQQIDDINPLSEKKKLKIVEKKNTRKNNIRDCIDKLSAMKENSLNDKTMIKLHRNCKKLEKNTSKILNSLDEKNGKKGFIARKNSKIDIDKQITILKRNTAVVSGLVSENKDLSKVIIKNNHSSSHDESTYVKSYSGIRPASEEKKYPFVTKQYIDDYKAICSNTDTSRGNIYLEKLDKDQEIRKFCYDYLSARHINNAFTGIVQNDTSRDLLKEADDLHTLLEDSVHSYSHNKPEIKSTFAKIEKLFGWKNNRKADNYQQQLRSWSTRKLQEHVWIYEVSRYSYSCINTEMEYCRNFFTHIQGWSHIKANNRIKDVISKIDPKYSS